MTVAGKPSESRNPPESFAEFHFEEEPPMPGGVTGQNAHNAALVFFQATTTENSTEKRKSSLFGNKGSAKKLNENPPNIQIQASKVGDVVEKTLFHSSKVSEDSKEIANTSTENLFGSSNFDLIKEKEEKTFQKSRLSNSELASDESINLIADSSKKIQISDEKLQNDLVVKINDYLMKVVNQKMNDEIWGETNLFGFIGPDGFETKNIEEAVVIEDKEKNVAFIKPNLSSIVLKSLANRYREKDFRIVIMSGDNWSLCTSVLSAVKVLLEKENSEEGKQKTQVVNGLLSKEYLSDVDKPEIDKKKQPELKKTDLDGSKDPKKNERILREITEEALQKAIVEKADEEKQEAKKEEFNKQLNRKIQNREIEKFEIEKISILHYKNKTS